MSKPEINQKLPHFAPFQYGLSESTLQWGVEKDRILLENLKNNQMSAVFAVDGKKEVLFDSSEKPTVGFRSVDVIVGGKRVAGVEVPMIIPGKT